MQITCVHCQFEFEIEQFVDDTVACRRCGKTFSASSGREEMVLPTAVLPMPAHAEHDDAPTETFHSRTTLTARNQVGPYELLEKLGEGGFGVVYRARHQILNRFDAVKLPRRDRFLSDLELREFLREAAIAVELSHPNIVPVFTAEWARDGQPFIAMRLMSGKTFSTVMRSRPPLPQVVQMLVAVCDAIQFAHRRGYFHRDLKPSNILLDEEGVPHVSDFGLALHIDEQLDRPGDGRCSRLYAAPEQIEARSEHLDGRCDVYAVGAMLYEVLAGCPVFQGTPNQVVDQILHRHPVPPSQRVPAADVPEDLELLCLECLQKEIDKRPRSMQVVSERLTSWLARQSPATCADVSFPPADSRTPHAAKRVTWASPLLLCGGGLAVALALLVASNSQDSPSAALHSPDESGGGNTDPQASINFWREPDLIDRWALASRRFPLLGGVKTRPVRHIWPTSEVELGPDFSAETETLRLNSREFATCVLGQTKSQDWRYSVPMHNSARTGTCGLFFGCRPATNHPYRIGGDEVWQMSCIALKSEDGKTFMLHRRIHYGIRQGDRWSYRGIVGLAGCKVDWNSGSRQLLEVWVEKDRVHEVRWNGAIVGLDDYALAEQDQLRSPFDHSPLDLPTSGWLGVMNEAGSTTFEQIEFTNLDRSASDAR
ncbi:MAG: protein kinase [Pirellulales bacterium]